MRVFVAGATGAIGRPVLRDLVAAGHDVTGTTRSAEKTGALRAAGAAPVIVDALDDAALRTAVLDARPDVVVHELTDLSAPLNPRKYREWMAGTNRLRTGATRTLLDVEDAAAATVAALDRGGTGVLNVVDDVPALMREWVPGLARVLGARSPRRVPVWLAKLAAGREMVATATQARGASNARARERLGWAPRYPIWREGFPAVFGG